MCVCVCGIVKKDIQQSNYTFHWISDAVEGDKDRGYTIVFSRNDLDNNESIVFKGISTGCLSLFYAIYWNVFFFFFKV